MFCFPLLILKDTGMKEQALIPASELDFIYFLVLVEENLLF